MTNTDLQHRLEMRWLPVLDGSGRTRMEATWLVVPAIQDVPAVTVHAA